MNGWIVALVAAFMLSSASICYACLVIASNEDDAMGIREVNEVPVGKRFGSTVAEPTVEGVWHE